ncbi:YlxM family DNA-binding protein [Acidaminobacter hydrogenoformans]|uniref:UPF0122 protein SAMN03080599_00466 n=1 Tax=Acidaminobacter hydrogenoformans DSM 2784 TaxID=1120920 RepID=A0A1G5RSD4_9FIRM|nr:YlxM family DNA-binding protein [Acidaminobacter hydrogenoformans]SCZ76906.1 hypothetical protein SAMN03080599_00466 [Acidaminobacter hydrogenoformans DSM 2784]
MFDKKIKLGTMFEFYGQLLTEKQQEILEDYCILDLSFGEISEELGISRQAVYDTIKRAEKQLDQYEDKLGMAARFEQREKAIRHLVDGMREIDVKISEEAEASELHERISELIREASDILE